MSLLPGNLSLTQAVPLLTASLDLQLVRTIRDAIRTADLTGGKCFPVTAIGPAPNCCPGRVTNDCYEPRRRIEPTPVYEPRRHIHPSPYYEPCKAVGLCPVETQPVIPALVEPAAAAANFKIEPPWKSLPWKNPLPPPEKSKVIVRVIDNNRRGQMIDLFI